VYTALSFFTILHAKENLVHDIVIIGSGPAGLTAALYAGRAGLKPLVICGNMPGGQLTMAQTVSNWLGYQAISGANLMKNFMDHAASVGAQYIYDTVVSIDTNQKPFIIKTEKENYICARSIIIATGTKQKRLSCKGENEYWGKGISHCALCEGALFKNKNVLVVGGGNAALENARHLKNFTKNITIITPEERFTADVQIKNEILEDPLYTIYYNCIVKEFFGDENGITDAILLFEKNNEEKKIPIQGAFVAIGFTPSLDFFMHSKPALLQQQDLIKTAIDGIFIAVSTRYNQAIFSAGLGCAAVIEAIKYLGR